MPRPIAEILTELAEHKDEKAVAEALATALPEVQRVIHTTGFAAGKKEGTKETKALTDRILAIEAERDEAQERATEAEKKAPDVQALRVEQKEQLRKVREEAEQKLKAEQKRTLAALRKVDVADFQAALVEQKIDPTIARMQAKFYEDRFQYNDAGQLEVLGEDGIPYTAPAGKRLFEPLVAEIRKSAPPHWLTSTSDRGGAGRPAGGSDDRPVLEEIEKTKRESGVYAAI